ncbi:hypothetical protein ACEF39_000258 [Stenotrophomonas indicatrix]
MLWSAGSVGEIDNERRRGKRTSLSYTAPSGDDALEACNVRKGAQGRVVTQVPVGSDYKELIIDYPDGRFLCMMRNNGQVQSVTPIGRRGG